MNTFQGLRSATKAVHRATQKPERRQAHRPAALTIVAIGLLAAGLLGSDSLGPGALQAQDNIQVSARIEPQPVGLDQPARFTLTVEAGGLRGPGAIEPRFELENFAVVHGPSVEQSVRFGTGGSGRTVSYIWYLRALETGNAAVNSIEVRVGNRDVALPNQKVEVVEKAPHSSRSPSARSGRRDPLSNFFRPFERRRRGRVDPREPREADAPQLFLRSVVTNDQPWVGQRIDYITYLYTRENVLDLQPVAVPTFEGLWVRDTTPPDRQPKQERVEWQDDLYVRIPIFRRTLYPLRADDYVIEPVEARMIVRQIDPFFGLSRAGIPATLNRESNSVRLEVRELPAAPSDFSGAVGRLATEIELSPETLDVGQAATLTVELTGTGQLEALETPELDLPPGLTAYPAQEDSIEGDGRTLKRTWRYSIVAQEPGEFRITAPSLRFFDPVSETYAATEPIERTLAAQAVVDDPQNSIAVPAASTGTLHPIRSASVPLTSRSIEWRRLLPWAFGVPWFLGVALLVARRPRRLRETGEVQESGRRRRSPIGGLLRRRQTGEQKALLRRFVADLSEASTAGRPRRMAAGFEEAWRVFLDRTGWLTEPTAAGSWPEALRDAGASGETVERMIRWLDDLHYLRYAPELSATDALTDDLVARARQLGRTLLQTSHRPSMTPGDPQSSEPSDSAQLSSSTSS